MSNNITSLVSILIPLYNRGEMIVKTLDSIKQQTHRHWECIIVDDDSTDDSYAVVEAYIADDTRFRLYRRPSHLQKGANNCRNYGFEQSKGYYINWFDSDDVMLPEFLATKLKHIEGFNLNLCGYYLSDEHFTVMSRYDVEPVADILREHILWKLKIITNCVFFRRSFLIGKPLFDEKISRGQETELFTRLFQGLDPCEVGFITEPLFYYVQHEGSISNGMSSNSARHIESRLFVYRKALSLYPGDKEILQKLYHGVFILAVYSKKHAHPALLEACFDLLDQILGHLPGLKYRVPLLIIKSAIPKSTSLAYRLKDLFKI
ncbi:glycosyltransferase family 2 protein [Sphingobacterium sp. MYb388]|uniref:glycosyltransferase family 2 protein n=1 Tax=Sphingobacterium sp. MYb388 TaxID=2745437 RepID=UPI003098ACDB